MKNRLSIHLPLLIVTIFLLAPLFGGAQGKNTAFDRKRTMEATLDINGKLLKAVDDAVDALTAKKAFNYKSVGAMRLQIDSLNGCGKKMESFKQCAKELNNLLSIISRQTDLYRAGKYEATCIQLTSKSSLLTSLANVALMECDMADINQKTDYQSIKLVILDSSSTVHGKMIYTVDTLVKNKMIPALNRLENSTKELNSSIERFKEESKKLSEQILAATDLVRFVPKHHVAGVPGSHWKVSRKMRGVAGQRVIHFVARAKFRNLMSKPISLGYRFRACQQGYENEEECGEESIFKFMVYPNKTLRQKMRVNLNVPADWSEDAKVVIGVWRIEPTKLTK